MRRLVSLGVLVAMTGVASAGFKVKLIKPKKPEQFQARASAQNVTYAGTFGPLGSSQRSDSCHANTAGQQLLGEQAIDKWGE